MKKEKNYKIHLSKTSNAYQGITEEKNKIVYNKKMGQLTRQKVLKNTLVELNFRVLVGKHFDKITDNKVRYKILKGAKGTKKSESIIAWIIFQMVFKPKYNALVIRRYLKDHQETTVAGFSTVLQRIEAKFGWDYQKFWKMSSPQSNQPYIWFNRYGINGEVRKRQEVRLISWENTDVGSQKWHNGGYCGTIHWEEPLEKIDTKKGGAELTDEFMEEQWPILEESFLRYDSITNKPEDVGMQEVLMSFNSWNKYHFVVRNYVYAFMQENEEALEKYGKQEYYSQKAHQGLGTYIMLMTWKVNEFRTKNEIKMIFALRKRNYRDYRTVYLGLDYIFTGGVLSDIWHMTKVQDDDLEDDDFDEIVFGGDWSSSKDRSGMVVSKVWYGYSDAEGQYIKKIRVFDNKVFDAQKGNDIKRANLLLDWVDGIIKRYPEFKGKIYALIDNRDAFWIDYMNQHKHRYDDADYCMFLPAPKQDSHKNSAGQLSRAFALRALIISGIIEFDQASYLELKQEAETLEWIDEGKISDGKDDFFQMTGYMVSNKITMITKSTGLGYN